MGEPDNVRLNSGATAVLTRRHTYEFLYSLHARRFEASRTWLFLTTKLQLFSK